MSIVLLITALAIVGGVVAVSRGRGGELAMFPRDALPYRPALRTPIDVATLRPHRTLLGYQVDETDDALRQVAWQLAERDRVIAELRSDLASVRAMDSPAAGDTVPGSAGD